MKKEKSIKIRGDLITKKMIWDVADVMTIPKGQIREVYYNWERAELFAITMGKREWYYRKTGEDFLYPFHSLDEFWIIGPVSEKEAGITEDMSEEEIKKIAYKLYRKYFYKDFKFPDWWER